MKLNLGKLEGSVFGSQSLTAHLARGGLAAALLWLALAVQAQRPLLALLAVAGMLVLMRGCPVCWTVGLIETWQARRRTATDTLTDA